jgi:hypothetical protein
MVDMEIRNIYCQWKGRLIRCAAILSSKNIVNARGRGRQYDRLRCLHTIPLPGSFTVVSQVHYSPLSYVSIYDQ